MKRASGILLAVVGALLCIGCWLMAAYGAGDQVGLNQHDQNVSRIQVFSMMLHALVTGGWWLAGFAASGALMVWGLHLAKKPEGPVGHPQVPFEPPTKEETRAYVRQFEDFLKQEDGK